jgi:hypothetical protein
MASGRSVPYVLAARRAGDAAAAYASPLVCTRNKAEMFPLSVCAMPQSQHWIACLALSQR